MTPALARSGLWLLGSAACFLLAGAFLAAWPLLALGFLELAFVLFLYVLFVPCAAMLRRRSLELAWWVPVGEQSGGALLVDRPLHVRLLLRNRSPFRLAVQRLRIVASGTLLVDEPLPSSLPARQEVRLDVRAVPRQVGHWFFQGVLLDVTDRFGVVSMQLYFPSLLGIKVFPLAGPGRQRIPFRPRTGASHERVGPRLLRQRGLGTDLREIREHLPGDPFKRIAWKASARARKLMVRENESEVLVTHWLLLDISPTMRSQRPGRSKLDFGIHLAAAFARSALDGGDRVGLCTFDHRIYSQLPPSDGQTQLHGLMERLLELHTIVDQDLTDLTDGELCAAIAEYLAFQAGIRTRVHGRLPDGISAQEAGFFEGPRGELYNRTLMMQEVRRVITERQTTLPRSFSPALRTGSDDHIQLRLFCRLCGLEIPYRRHSPVTTKERGMAEAVGRSGAARRSQFLVLISDLEEIHDSKVVLDALRLARRRSHSILVVAPFAPAFFPGSQSGHSRRVQDIFAWRAQRQRSRMTQAISRLGIPVLSAGPDDLLPLLLRRLSRLRLRRGGQPG